MTLYKPNLQLRKLRVMAGAFRAYSADFHSGVNIINGQNASGKSTIMDFLFFGLGGESIPWKNEALICTDVFIEIEANGTPLTLRRSVNEAKRNPLNIFWGNLTKAEVAPFSEWDQYPYQRSASKESFSQVLFRAFGLPELKGESASNITIHQLLRLMYVDQRTSHDEIFRSEPFDTQLTRETVGNYLCGIYSDRLYEAKLELKTVEVELVRSVSDLRSLFSILGKTGQKSANTTDFLQAEAQSVTQEIAELRDKLAQEKSYRRSKLKDTEGAAARIGDTRARLTDLQQQFALKTSELTELQLEDKDSAQFISELERRIEALADSDSVRTHFGRIQFSRCPCCYSQIHEISAAAVCSLCKSKGDPETVASQVLRMKNELALQQTESRKIQLNRRRKIETITLEIPQLRQKLRSAEETFYSMAADWSTPEEAEIERLNNRLGSLTQRLEQINEYHRFASVVEELKERRDFLNRRRLELSDLILVLEESEQNAKDVARKSIFDELIVLLRRDLPRQEEFISAAAVDWNFAENRVSVNGQRQFSESSMVILKHCFHLALLAASSRHESFRLPRFLMLDGIDDGGQELERSHALQNSIVELSHSLPSSHQIVFATSQIAPNLANSPLVVGATSTVQSKTLRMY